MRKRKFPIFLVLGTALILISVSLILVRQIRTYIGGEKGQEIVEKMEALLPDRSAGVPGFYPNPYMPVLEIDGEDYVALLEIPTLKVSLPVADQWDPDQLWEAPSRFYGSAYEQTLVIGGADSSYQFAFCDQIENGTAIIVTDMTGTQFTYTVTSVERSSVAESQWLIDSEYSLTLFCRDTYSMEYIAVRCAPAHS